jgi:hypothetical protein
MRWYENHAVDDVFGIGRNKILEREVEPLMKQAEAAFAETGQKQRQFGETDYQASTWDRPRRVIMKAERLEAGPNRRFIVPTLEGQPQTLYDEVYLPASRQGKPHQGTATDALRRSDQLPSLRGQPVLIAALQLRVRPAVRTASHSPGQDRHGDRSGHKEPTDSSEDRGSRDAGGSPSRAAPVPKLPLPERVPPRRVHADLHA